MASVEAIGEQFISSYYQLFDTNRAGLGQLYREESEMIFEGAKVVGRDAIVQKLVVIQHQVSCKDIAMTVDGGVMVFVIGQLKTDNDPIQTFSQCFYLKQVGDGLFVMNDIFRLALHHQ